MSATDWAKGLPEKEIEVHFDLCRTIEKLIAQAHHEQDHALLRAAASAWLLAGYAPQWIVQPLDVAEPDYVFVEDAFRGRERRKIRNEGLGLLRALIALHRAQA